MTVTGLVVDEMRGDFTVRLMQVTERPVGDQFTFDGSLLTLSEAVVSRGNALRVRAWRTRPDRFTIPDVAEFVIHQQTTGIVENTVFSRRRINSL